MYFNPVNSQTTAHLTHYASAVRNIKNIKKFGYTILFFISIVFTISPSLRATKFEYKRSIVC